MRPRSRMASRICSRYIPEVYISVWLMPRYSTPSSASESIITALKCSAQLRNRLPGGAGTAVSGLPMCSAQDGSIPAGTLRNRSKSSQEMRCSTSCPRRRISSATRCGVMTSRRLPRWMGPDGLRPEAQTIGLPGERRSASAITSSAYRFTQSTPAPATSATISHSR